MRLANALFVLTDKTHGQCRIAFQYDDTGQPTTVKLQLGDASHVIANGDHRYKPCATHCQKLFRTMIDAPPKTKNEARKRREARPALGLHRP